MTGSPRFWQRGWVALLTCGILSVASTGCIFKGARQIFMPPTPRQEIWQPRPVSLRVYPASRFVTDPAVAGVLLEARIELLDDMGDAIKGVGEFHLELLGEPGRGRTTMDRRLCTWEVPLLTPEQQRARYDRVTRTYRFRLKLDQPVPPTTDTRLKVWFTPTGGHRLDAETIMPGQERSE